MSVACRDRPRGEEELMKPACMMLLFFQVFTYIPEEAAQYVGGTITTIPKQAAGELITADENILSFTWQKAGQSGGGEWRIPYKRVTYLGYGQHAERRVGTAVALAPAAVMMMPVFVPVMWSKKRRHYITLAFKDDQDKAQTAMFLVGKKSIRTLPAILEARTGVKLQYEDEEAKKVGNK
jgi:hypothetical protein